MGGHQKINGKKITGSAQKKMAMIRDGKAKKQGGKCYWCSSYFTKENFVTAEHLLSLSEGGQNNYKNIVAACNNCNNFRGKILSIKIALRQKAIKRLRPIFWLSTLTNHMGI